MERAIAPTPARVQMPSADSIAAPTQTTVAELPLISVALNTPKTMTAPTDTGTNDAVVANTPSGVGDPNAIVCRAAQRIAGTDQFGPQACGHKYDWWKLAINGKDLAPDGKTLIDKPTVANPRGEGDPQAVTCRTPKFVDRGPLVPICRTNRFWADIVKNRQVVDARGEVWERSSGCGGECSFSDSGNNSWPGHDTGMISQSAGTLNNR